MIGSFKFNNIDSSSFGLVCKSVKRPLLPAKKVNRTEKVGASGVYDFDNNEYFLRTVIMKITYLGTSFEELRTRARSIAAWLSTDSWVKLIINDESDKYYLAKITKETLLDSLWESGTAELTFDCQPFAHSVDEVDINENLIISERVINFTNQATRVINFKSPPGSKYLITAVGTWTSLTFTSGGKSLTYSKPGSGDMLIINNTSMKVFQNGSSTFSFLTGDIDTFLEITPGDNTITISGTELSVDVEISYIPLWI